MLRWPRASKAQATRLPAGAARNSDGNGALSTCSMVNEPPGACAAAATAPANSTKQA
jgi:hypothetical protein